MIVNVAPAGFINNSRASTAMKRFGLQWYLQEEMRAMPAPFAGSIASENGQIGNSILRPAILRPVDSRKLIRPKADAETSGKNPLAGEFTDIRAAIGAVIRIVFC